MVNRFTVAALAGLAFVASGASARPVNFTDPAGDLFTNAGGGILDIIGMEVSNDASSISFKFTLNGDVTATDWGKYMVAIDKGPGGDAAGNGWGRPITMPAGMDIWLGSWVDGGNGLENRQWDGAAWQLAGATYNATPGLTISKTAGAPSDVIISVLLADLGLAPGDTIFFDAFSSGGGNSDGAIDSLANPLQSVADWGNAYEFGPGTNNPFLTYVLVPGPGSAALLGLGVLVAGRRRR